MQFRLTSAISCNCNTPPSRPSVRLFWWIDPDTTEATAIAGGPDLAACCRAIGERVLPERPCIAASLDQEQRHDAQNGPQGGNSSKEGQTPSEGPSEPTFMSGNPKWPSAASPPICRDPKWPSATQRHDFVGISKWHMGGFSRVLLQQGVAIRLSSQMAVQSDHANTARLEGV